MKRKHNYAMVVLLLLTFFTGNAFAQSWLLNGNAGTTNTNFLGTTDNKKLRIKTNNLERITITAGGNVGIANTSPSEKLDIAGNMKVDGNLVFSTGQDFIQFANPGTSPEPMMYMLSSGTVNNTRMVLAHSPAYKYWGLQYNDTWDKFDFVMQDAFGIQLSRLTIDLGDGNVGIRHSLPNHDLELGYNDAAKPTSSLWTVSSDERLKTNISDFTDGLNIINQIRPVWFNYNGVAKMPTDERGVGTIAQELQKIAPYMVKNWTYEDEVTREKTDYLAVDYNAMLFMFVNAFKEQQAMIEEKDALITAQQEQVNELKNAIAEIKSALIAEGILNLQEEKFPVDPSPDNRLHQHESNLFSADLLANKLFQNEPNPFTNETSIRFSIQHSSSAQIIISDLMGKQMKVFNVSNIMNEVKLNSGELQPGTYQYTLYIDGQKVDSKQMLVAK